MFEFAMILCAGKGERLSAIKGEIPKALLSINGKPLISYTVGQIRSNIDYLGFTINDKCRDLIQYGLENQVSDFINTTNRENAWWLFNSHWKHINSPIVVFPCDNLTLIDLDFIYSSYKALNCPPCMLVPVERNILIEGDFIHKSEDSSILNISRENVADIYCSGIQVLNPFIINQICQNKFDFLALWKSLITQKQLYCSPIYPHSWFSINTPGQFEFAKNFLNIPTNDYLSHQSTHSVSK